METQPENVKFLLRGGRSASGRITTFTTVFYSGGRYFYTEQSTKTGTLSSGKCDSARPIRRLVSANFNIIITTRLVRIVFPDPYCDTTSFAFGIHRPGGSYSATSPFSNACVSFAQKNSSICSFIFKPQEKQRQINILIISRRHFYIYIYTKCVQKNYENFPILRTLSVLLSNVFLLSCWLTTRP